MTKAALYGASVIAVVGVALGLTIYEANAERPDPPAASGPPSASYPDTEVPVADASVLTDVQVARTDTGAILTAQAVTDDPAILGTEFERLASQYCADNISVVTDNNLRIHAWGFCYSTIPATDFAELIDVAVETEASKLVFTDHPGSGGIKQAAITWLPTTQASYDAVLESWEEIELPESIRQVALTAYGREYMDYADLRADGLTYGTNSSNPRAAAAQSG